MPMAGQRKRLGGHFGQLLTRVLEDDGLQDGQPSRNTIAKVGVLTGHLQWPYQGICRCGSQQVQETP